MSIEIQQIRMDDVDELYDIELECFSTEEAFTKEQIRHLIKNKNSIGFVAKIDHKVVGFTIGLINKNEFGDLIGHVVTIDVAMEYRRKGVGIKLLKKLESEFKTKNVKTCFLEVRIDNKAAQSLYKKLGYVEIVCLKDYYGKGVHGILFKKKLK